MADGARRGLRECPVFHPTMDEFRNFEQYVMSIEPQCVEHGICKIVPPPGWKPRVSPYEDKDDMQLNGPVRQEAIGHGGTFQCMNVTQKPMTIGEFKKLALKDENLPPLQEHELTWTPEQRAKADFWDLEKKYWQSISLKPPVYGADNFSASFFEDCAGAWNLSRLDSLLRRRIHSTIPGVTAPYLYMGMWKATFAWHVEDMDLYSINYLHYGAEKIWYSASAADGKRLERIAAEIFPKSANHCGQFLRHKMHIINPSLITQRGVNLTRVVHRAGEYVISFPYAYHCGFNVALNCAESCNFASQNWVPYGLKVKACKCFEDSVKIKMSIFTSDKAMKKHNRAASNADGAVDDILCEVCSKGHDDHTILLCDSCTAGYHMACLPQPLAKKPPGLWLCPDCQEEEDEEQRVAEEKANKSRKCCACGTRGEEAAVHHLLASAWAGAALELGEAPAGRFSLCKKCAGRQEQSWRLGPAEAVMGAPKPCCICMGEGSGGGKGGKGGGALNPRTIMCSGCPRVHCLTCLSRNVEKARQPPSPAKGARGGGGGGAFMVPDWLCPVCDPKTMASVDELAVAAKRRAAYQKAAEAGGWEGDEVRALVQCLFDAPDAPAEAVADAVGSRSASEVRMFLSAVRKACGVGATKASPVVSIPVVEAGGKGNGWMRAYTTDCHACGGRMENKVGGGGGGVRFRCQMRRCRREICLTCIKNKQAKDLKGLVAAASRAASGSPHKASDAWPFKHPVWPSPGTDAAPASPSKRQKTGGGGGAALEACWVENPPGFKCAACRGECWCVGGSLRCWRRKDAVSRGEGVRGGGGGVEGFVAAVMHDKRKEADIDTLICAAASDGNETGKSSKKRGKAGKSEKKAGKTSSMKEMVQAAARALEADSVTLSDSDSDISIDIPVIAVSTKHGSASSEAAGKGGGKAGGQEESEFDRLVREAASYV